MKSLLSKIQSKNFVFDIEARKQTISLKEYPYTVIDEATLEVEVLKEQGLNNIFEQLSAQGVKVLSMRNKANRLEELFLTITEEKHEENKNHE